METAVHGKEIRKDNPVLRKIGRVIIWVLLIALAAFTLIPFVWMISSSLKLDREVFAFPMRWIPETFHWENYSLIWEKVPLLTYFKNTAFIAIVVTILQTLTSSFAAYAFAKLNFRGRDVLFLCYIGTIAVPWQAYMLPQFIMMRSMGLYDTLWAMVVLQAFSAFGVFLMRQFYRSIPTELCEAARLDGLSEYGIWARIMLPLSKAAIATLVIFTFVNTWNDYMGPMIYLTRDINKTVQVGLRRFIQENSSDYHLIMAASLCSLLPVSIVFLCLQPEPVSFRGGSGKLGNSQSGAAGRDPRPERGILGAVSDADGDGIPGLCAQRQPPGRRRSVFFPAAEAVRVSAGLLRLPGGADRSRDRRDLVHCGGDQLGRQRA